MKLSETYVKELRGISTAPKVPCYDRDKLSAGILHVGVGNFHRAHMAAYLDDLFHKGIDHDWAIVGAGIMSFDANKRASLEPQDWLSTLVERDAETTTPRIVGSMIDFLPVDEDHASLKQILLDPKIKIVSLTVTEGGYYLDETGAFDPKNPKILADAANPESPNTVFGMMVQALKKRRDAGQAPFTIMSCDNIPQNGTIARGVVVGLAGLYDKDLADWIDNNVAFPNSMVDRITPVTNDETRKYVTENYGYQDSNPIFCEPFRQWVLEDTFTQGRPALDKVGVQYVKDVEPYEKMKIRILNGGHAALCYPAALLGIKTVNEAMEHPVVGPFLDALERTEIIPCVHPVPGTTPTEYWEVIKERFSNPAIGDSIERVCYDGANRQPKFIIPAAADCLKAGRSVDGLALVSAMWCQYCQGLTKAGVVIQPNDPIWDRLQEISRAPVEDESLWLGMFDIYGEVGKDPRFAKSFAEAQRTISECGVEKAMQQYIEKCKNMELPTSQHEEKKTDP